MRDNEVPVKTAAGQREIAQRQLKLHSKTRSLLIAVHGEHSVGELRQQFQALGDVAAILEELRGLGLVTTATATAPGSPVVAPKVAANDEVPATQLAKQFMNETAVATLGLRATEALGDGVHDPGLRAEGVGEVRGLDPGRQARQRRRFEGLPEGVQVQRSPGGGHLFGGEGRRLRLCGHAASKTAGRSQERA